MEEAFGSTVRAVVEAADQVAEPARHGLVKEPVVERPQREADAVLCRAVEGSEIRTAVGAGIERSRPPGSAGDIAIIMFRHWNSPEQAFSLGLETS
jgi:hypothetical protein